MIIKPAWRLQLFLLYDHTHSLCVDYIYFVSSTYVHSLHKTDMCAFSLNSCYHSVVPYGSYPERSHLDVDEGSYVELKKLLAASQWSRKQRNTAVLTLPERVHTVLGDGRLRVGQEQRIRVMARCWNALGGLDRWYK